MNRKGFISSAALAIVIFSVTIMLFAHLFVVSDLHSASQTGYVVESSRWAADLSNYSCREDLHYRPDVFNELKTPVNYDRLGDDSEKMEAEYSGNELMGIKTVFKRNYKPTLHLSIRNRAEDDMDFNLKVCNPEGTTLEDLDVGSERRYYLFYNSSSGWEEIKPEDDKHVQPSGTSEDWSYDHSYSLENASDVIDSGVHEFKTNLSEGGRVGKATAVKEVPT